MHYFSPVFSQTGSAWLKDLTGQEVTKFKTTVPFSPKALANVYLTIQ